MLETVAVGEHTEAALRRGRSFAAIDDPALAAVHDIAVVEGRVVLAREHVEGTGLMGWASVAANGRAVVTALVPVARALARIHAAGLCLGNLSADAILVGSDGRGRITAAVLGAPEGSPDSDRAALCEILFAALRRGSHAAPRHVAALDPSRLHSSDELAHRLASDPVPLRRRVVVGAVAVTVATIAVVAYSRARTEPGCDGAGERLARVWDDDVRKRVRGALEATQAPFAGDVADSVEEALDRHADEWTQAHVVACEQRRTDEGDESEHRARTRCLDERLDAIAAVVDVLAQADGTVVRNAVEASRSIASASTCLEAPAALSGDSDAIRHLRRELARARALQHAGKYADAMPAAQDVVRSADALGDDDTAVEALHVVGVLQWQSGEATTADETLLLCVGRSWVADRPDVAAQAWGQLVYLRAEHVGDFAAAHLAARHAQATLARIGEAPAIEAAIRMSLGTLAQRDGRYADGIQHYAAALEAYERAGADEIHIANARINFANALIRVDRLDEALAHQQQALAIYRRVLGDVHPETANARESLAALHHARDEDEQALPLAEEVYAVRVQTLGPRHRSTLVALGNVAAFLVDLQRWDDAEQTLQRALADTRRFVGAEDPNVFFLLSNLAIVAGARGDHEAALRHCKEAQRLAPSPEHPNAATAIHCQGRSLAALGHVEEALDHYRRALALQERGLGPAHKRVAATLGDIGVALATLARDPAEREEAIASLQRALAIHERRRSPERERAPLREALAAALDQKSAARSTGGGETPESK